MALLNKLHKLNKLNNITMYCIKYRNNSTTIDILNIFNKNLNDYILFKKQQHKDIMELENKKHQLNALNSILIDGHPSHCHPGYSGSQYYKKMLEIANVKLD